MSDAIGPFASAVATPMSAPGKMAPERLKHFKAQLAGEGQAGASFSHGVPGLQQSAACNDGDPDGPCANAPGNGSNTTENARRAVRMTLQMHMAFQG